MELNKKKFRFKIIPVILLLGIVVSCVILASGWLKSQEGVASYERIAKIAYETTAITEADNASEEVTFKSPINFEALAKINPDIVGWITVPGTVIDYPIVQTSDNDKYLHTNFEGKKSKMGAVFLDFESNSDFTGWNNILYGHNMKNGSMFQDVNKFKKEDYFNGHRDIYIYTPDRTIHLKTIASYYGNADPMIRKTSFKSQENFNKFVKAIQEPCEYTIAPKGEISTLFSLVTCSYEIDDARTFLFAYEVND